MSTGGFFFSSRRRHTRSLCDWSSDVCSSDLPWARLWRSDDASKKQSRRPFECWILEESRSEERRVGKECRCQCWPYAEEDKERFLEVMQGGRDRWLVARVRMDERPVEMVDD